MIIGGVGGQGNVLASQILGQMLVTRGYVITIGETYGASQRGGAVMSHLRLSEKDQFSPLIPEGRCDLLVSLEPVEALRILEPYGHPGVMTLINTRPIFPHGCDFRERCLPRDLQSDRENTVAQQENLVHQCHGDRSGHGRPDLFQHGHARSALCHEHTARRPARV